MEAAILAAMHKADLPPEFSYAYRKTGLLGLGEDKSRWPPEGIKEWNDAVDEYRAMQARPDKPHGWNTLIPELLISPFTQQDHDQVREVHIGDSPHRGAWDEGRDTRRVGRCAFVLGLRPRLHQRRGRRPRRWPQTVCAHRGAGPTPRSRDLRAGARVKMNSVILCGLLAPRKMESYNQLSAC